VNLLQLGSAVAAAAGFPAYPQSVAEQNGVIFFIGRRGLEKRVCLAWPDGTAPALLSDFCGERLRAEANGRRLEVQAGRLDHMNAAGLRKHLPWTRPRTIGLRTSVGLGDRLGLATPAHVRAVRGTGLDPFFAQQSIREMQRTGRSPDEVMDTATFGVFQEGFREGFGADADHLKTMEDVDRTIDAGFTMFTIDPGDHVDDAAHTDAMATLSEKARALPWEGLETSADDMRARWSGRRLLLPDDSTVLFDEETLLRAVGKYGRALAHTVRMYRHLVGRMGGRPFELEMSVDETATPTSVAEHVFVASELRRLSVQWVSLAPRFIGEFEKGVDYIGDLEAFRRSFAEHVAVLRHFGPYKISIHSGSDKFSIYSIAVEVSDGLVHLKTAGTSYLEALRAIARMNPALFRRIMAFAIACYPRDRTSYHVSASVARVPEPGTVADIDLPAALDQFDTREVMHVTFGSVLNSDLRDPLIETLLEQEEAHYETVRAHIEQHLKPFVKAPQHHQKTPEERPR
jgi:hypothetical protein